MRHLRERARVGPGAVPCKITKLKFVSTRADGFSLVEVLTVAAIVAILAIVSVPAIAAGMKRYSLISASQQVASTIRLARYQAIGRDRTLRVRFNHPAAGQYRVLNNLNVAVGAIQYLPSGATFGAVSGDLEINTSGRVTALAGALPATIVMTNGDQNRTITVSASGRVELP